MFKIIRLLLVILLLYILAVQEANCPEPTPEAICSEWREETKYFIWMDGCQITIEELFKGSGQKIHPFAISQLCHDYFEKRFSVK